MNYFKCDCCGRFLSYAAIDAREITPDTPFTNETWATVCTTCKENDNETVTGDRPVGSHSAPSRNC